MKNEKIEETDINFSLAPHNTIIKNGKISQNINGIIETTKENDLIDNDTSSKRGETKNIINVYDGTKKIDNKYNKASYYLIQMDANNSSNKIPINSNIILDNYDYPTAIKYDKRKFCRIFYICILAKENIINIFFFRTPLDLVILRICLFIFNYSCDLAFNTIYYSNENISDKYHYKGNNLFLFILINNIIQIIISSATGLLLINLFQYLIDFRGNLEDLFKEEEKKMRDNKDYKVNKKRKLKIMEEIKKLTFKLKLKNMFFIIFEFLFMLFFYYFVTAFCEVYRKTQVSWIYDSITSFFISFIVEILFSFLLSLLYKMSLTYKIKVIYKLTIFLYNL
jgi:hypothetical protein